MFHTPKEKYWNTWSSQSPTIMLFLPAKFRVGLAAYSYADNTYTNFPFTKDMKLLEHDADGRYCALQAEHNGTVLQLEYFKTDDWTVRGRISVVKNGEWGLRFWSLVTMGFEAEGEIAGTAEAPVFGYRSYAIAPCMKDEAIRACLTDDCDYVGKSMVENGYYTPLEQAEKPGWCTFAYNMEETPVIEFAVSVTNEPALARQKAAAALALPEAELDAIRDTVKNALRLEGEYAGCADAMRDVMAWNTIADMKNSRTFTSLTRFWIDKKFGGWFVWLDDVFYHALINAYSGDWEMAQNNILAAVDNAVPADNLACLMAEFTEWVDRSQPPIAGFIVLKYYQLTHDLALVRRVFETLKKAHLWWFDNRDGDGNGVLEYGSSPVGNGHFKRTKLAAKDEAAMDNSPMFDKAVFRKDTNTINMEDVALNSLLALEGESLAELAGYLGDEETRKMLAEHTAAFKERIDRTLWDDERGLYANRHWEEGFVCPSPTSFYPLAAGIPDRERAERLIRHIFDKDEFWTEMPLPSIWAKDEAVHDDVYWRGRSWPPLNFFTYLGLRRYGFEEEAHRLARHSTRVFHRCWSEERACYENYNTFTGRGESVDADPFYGWGALLPLMWVLEHIGVDGENGFYFGSVDGADVAVDNLKAFDGSYRLQVEKGVTRLYRNGRLLLESDAAGRFRRFVCGEHYVRVAVPAQTEERYVRLPHGEPVRLTINGEQVEAAADIRIPAGAEAEIEALY